jgi:hypothetical protein
MENEEISSKQIFFFDQYIKVLFSPVCGDLSPEIMQRLKNIIKHLFELDQKDGFKMIAQQDAVNYFRISKNYEEFAKKYKNSQDFNLH